MRKTYSNPQGESIRIRLPYQLERKLIAEKVIDRRKEYKMLENIEVHTQYIHYSDLRVEAENVVKAIIGQHDIALYKQLFGKVEEA